MPKNNVTDPITDQEIAFAHMVLSGTITDRRAAEAVGLDPDSAAYTKSKPRVRAYMQEHRAAVQQRLVEQEGEGLRRRQISRDQILARLWEIANLSPETTRGSITGQVKALNMIMAIEGLAPDRRAVSGQKQPAPPPTYPEIDVQQAQTAGSEPFTVPVEEECGPQQRPAPGGAADPLRAPDLAFAAAPMFVSPPDTRAPSRQIRTFMVGANEL
jgi:hypothetical protein